MNIQEYISSGIIESYVLGLASPEERLEFEQFCATEPEVRAARDAFERSLEQIVLAGAVIPPARVKENVWSEIKPGSSPQLSDKHYAASGQMIVVKNINWARYLAAASIILLVASTALNFYFYSEYRSSVARLDELVKNQEQLVKNNDNLQTKLQQYESSLALIRNPNMAIITLKGQPLDPTGLSTVYWDKQSKDVYLLVNNLPQPASDKQYQLWAIVDGKPVDAGVFDMKDAGGLVKMKNIPRAQAFAITLEKKGGSPAPTMDAMHVMGQV